MVCLCVCVLIGWRIYLYHHLFSLCLFLCSLSYIFLISFIFLSCSLEPSVSGVFSLWLYSHHELAKNGLLAVSREGGKEETVNYPGRVW